MRGDSFTAWTLAAFVLVQVAQLAHPLATEPPGPLVLAVGDRRPGDRDGVARLVYVSFGSVAAGLGFFPARYAAAAAALADGAP
jgi:UDP:flavonoid glycosyltransferase YjiC (YdhE family)